MNCMECKNHRSTVYMELEDETLYNCWCEASMNIEEALKDEECSKFEQE